MKPTPEERLLELVREANKTFDENPIPGIRVTAWMVTGFPGTLKIMAEMFHRNQHLYAARDCIPIEILEESPADVVSFFRTQLATELWRQTL